MNDLYSFSARKSGISLTGLKSRCGNLHSFLEATGKDLFSCLFQLETASIPWLVAPSLIFKAMKGWEYFQHCLTLTVSLLPPSSTFKVPCDY